MSVTARLVGECPVCHARYTLEFSGYEDRAPDRASVQCNCTGRHSAVSVTLLRVPIGPEPAGHIVEETTYIEV